MKTWKIILGLCIVLLLLSGCQTNNCNAELKKVRVMCIRDFLEERPFTHEFKYIRIIDCENITSIVT